MVVVATGVVVGAAVVEVATGVVVLGDSNISVMVLFSAVTFL